MPIEFADIPPNWRLPLYWIGTEVRIIFARALDEQRSALVIEILGQYHAGVAMITRYDDGVHRYGLAGQDRVLGYTERWETRLWIVWEWRQHVASPEEFMDQRGWERPPSQQRIEGPRKRLTYGGADVV
jgi:hypothetical protein